MTRLHWIVLAAAGAAVSTGVALYSQARKPLEVAMPEAVAFRVLFGIGDPEPTPWDGSVKLSQGQVLRIEGWRFAENDVTDFKTSWSATTRYSPPRPGARRLGVLRGPVLENGVIITASGVTPQTRLDMQTKQGGVSFTAGELPYGVAKSFLEGKVRIDRVPPALQLTTSDEEQDFAALAQTNDEVLLAFVDFTHGDRAQAVQGQLKEEPKSFDFLARPVGGDQVKLMRYSKSRRVWTEPEWVSPPNEDAMRAAVASDGSGRVWVIWSASRKGNFDLYAKYKEAGKWSGEIRLTSDSGTDLNPVAATDARGRVWVAWQAFRDGSLDILTAAQDGKRFTAEMRVSTSPASDWDPSIAAAPNGEVAVSWDTYDKGDYDVWFRRLRFGRAIAMDAPVPVAASANFEARSSAAYDRQSRLWIAYEAASTRWGKDFGAYETSGVALYQGHNLRLKCFQGPNAFTTQADLLEAVDRPVTLFSPPRLPPRPDPARRLPDAALASQRRPNLTPQPGPLPRNSFPRLAVDDNGIVYLAYRTSTGARSPLGTTWHESVVYFDGAKWDGPLTVPHSDALLDMRAAMIVPSPGQLLMVVTTDHRQSAAGRRTTLNTDLYAAELRLDAKPQPPRLAAAPAEKVAPPLSEVAPELEQVKLMHSRRADLGGKPLQLMRGEFHRHTEISGDGGGDGPLIDAYRYMIDAAYMDWVGCCDHDNGGGREYFWWLEQKYTDAYKLGDRFIPMFSYERSVRYPEGHRNVIFARRGIRPLPRLPKVPDDAPMAPAPDTQMLYRYLRKFDGIAAVHTSGTGMGTDWRDNDPLLEPAVEIYQGDRQNYEIPGGPRSNSSEDSIGGWRPLGFVSLALQKGYRLAFEASSDHISTHMSYSNLWVEDRTREAILEAFKKRRLYGATDNILADVRSGKHFMGEEFSTEEPPTLQVQLAGTAPFAKVHIIKDNQYVYTAEPATRTVDFTWRDANAVKGKTSYYYVRGEQSDGELVWVSPMWITYR
ncbi:MAG: hypothetical protein HYZ57_03495 [Acidobacteria bacterium]|nr:hypothetical protein [Acidobacteriota bacterium]